jgi:hypothetical protein
MRPHVDDPKLFRQILLTTVVACAGMAGCAFDLAHVDYSSTMLSPSAEVQRTVVMETQVSVKTPCMHTRILKAGSTWQLVGSIQEGEVYKPLDQVLTVECSNIYEAYLVLTDRTLIGFYLPVEKGFVAIKKPLQLPVP